MTMDQLAPLDDAAHHTTTNSNDKSRHVEPASSPAASHSSNVARKEVAQEQEQTPDGHLVERTGKGPLASAPIDRHFHALKVGKQFINSSQDVLTNDDDGRPGKRSYPKKVLFIIANEFCERFSYYGLRTVLVLYFRSVLGFTDAGSTVSYHLFTTLCYLTPILGAILGDSLLGKYRTILYLSIVYFLGELLLVAASVWWEFDWLSIILTWVALLMIGIGTGGIKPCVSAFGGDQFAAHETKWRESFFSLFYGAINLGSLISMFTTPMLRANYNCVGRSDCYPFAFLLPCVLMFVSIVVFVSAQGHYYKAPLPEKNTILAFCQCTWLAFKRKLSGYKLPENRSQLLGHTNDANSSTSSLSTVSNITTAAAAGSGGQPPADATETTPVVSSNNKQQLMVATIERPKSDANNNSDAGPPYKALSGSGGGVQSSASLKRRNHWLYLAADCYDTNSIEKFRCVLAIFFLFLPTPMFWALYDQQGSIWTLQATRMNGRIWGTNFILEPDQMMVANPILLLASIPLFQLVIYPLFNKCNLLTTPIQKMTTGGLLAALTFVLSALIEFQIQANTPSEIILPNRTDLLLVNGISECALIEPKVLVLNESTFIDSIQPLAAHRLAVPTPARRQNQNSTGSSPATGPLYRLTFKLGNGVSSNATGQSSTIPISFKPQHGFASSNANTSVASYRTDAASSSFVGCPLDSRQTNELLIGPLSDRSVNMVYIEQGNGRVSHKLFAESPVLPPAGKARVRLLYESFGSYSQAMRRQFYLSKDSGSQKENSKPHPELDFNMTTRDGQVLLSNPIDVAVRSSGDTFTLKLFEPSGGTGAGLVLEHPTKIHLRPGTRNLIILQQRDAKTFELHQELLQENDYRISILYQLIPYMIISASEVLFSITGLEFSYSMAPPDMKSLILGAWCLTTAVGNLLTVAIESIHFFDNIVYDFLFYAALMTIDMLVFAIIGYYYEPYQPALKASQTFRRQPDDRDDDANRRRTD
jgi:dipeptide/tripeptide permease